MFHRTPFLKAVLVVTQDVVAFKEIHQMTVDDVFHDLEASQRHGNQSIVGSLRLYDGSDVKL